MFKFLILFLTCINCFSQSTPLKQLLEKHNTETIPYISVDSLQKIANDVFLLDTREPREYKVSHINNAICIGYDYFDINETIKKLPSNRNTKIIVYCSLGIRSEDIAEKLKKAGFTNIHNLYGGIFEWKNQGNSVVNKQNKATEKVHTFNKEWSKWLLKGEKVY